MDDPIGFFDSGLGGLTIYREVRSLLPMESTLYLADHKNFPYGDKSEEEVKTVTLAGLRWLLGQRVKLIAIACNSSTVSGIDYYREKFKSVSLVGVVPAVKTAVSETRTGNIAILSTEKTAKSEYQQKLITTYAAGKTVYAVGCKDLVGFVERGEVGGVDVDRVLRVYLEPLLAKQVDTIVLGCTHYPFLKKAIQAFVGPDIRVLDCGLPVAHQVKRILTGNNQLANNSSSTHAFFTTGDAEQVSKVASKLMDETMHFSHVDI